MCRGVLRQLKNEPVRPSPQDPDSAARVRASFAQQGLMFTIGASLELVEPGEVHIALPFSPALSQQHGYLHAGVTTAIADSANGYAALTLTPPGYEVLAVEFKINLMAPARAPRSEEHTSELQSHHDLVCRLLLEKKKNEHRSDARR